MPSGRYYVTLYAMPPVDYYIFNTVTGRYSNGRTILRPNVEINCNNIFMPHIIWSTGNAKVITQSPAILIANKKKWRNVGGRCWEKKVFLCYLMDWYWLCTSKQVGLEVNTIIGDVMGWQNSKSIELWRSDYPTISSQIGWPSVIRAWPIPNRGTVVIHGKYRSSEGNKSIVISIINRNVYRWFTAKRYFNQHNQERRPIRSVASDCLTKIFDTVSLNVIQK